MSTARNVVARYKAALSSSEWVYGADRAQYLDAVWDMYKSSYAKIGLIVSSPHNLLDEYDSWELFFHEGKPVAFRVWKTTPFGLKAGLLGSDGSGPGKTLVKQSIKIAMHKPGYYSEVSHAVEKLTEGSPVVCSVHVPVVLKKTIRPQPDGVHYERAIAGVGNIVKKMVGRPKGVPSSDGSHCPVPPHPGESLTPQEAQKQAASKTAEMFEAAEHLGNLCVLEGD
jgi:hypothetical protein